MGFAMAMATDFGSSSEMTGDLGNISGHNHNTNAAGQAVGGPFNVTGGQFQNQAGTWAVAWHHVHTSTHLNPNACP